MLFGVQKLGVCMLATSPQLKFCLFQTTAQMKENAMAKWNRESRYMVVSAKMGKRIFIACSIHQKIKLVISSIFISKTVYLELWVDACGCYVTIGSYNSFEKNILEKEKSWKTFYKSLRNVDVTYRSTSEGRQAHKSWKQASKLKLKRKVKTHLYLPIFPFICFPNHFSHWKNHTLESAWNSSTRQNLLR